MLKSGLLSWCKTALSRLRSWKWRPASISPRPVSVPKSPLPATPRAVSPEEAQRRAIAAQQLLENPLLQEAVGALEADLIAQIKAVRLDDKEAHTRLVMAFQISSTVTRHLWNTVQDGAHAREQIRLHGSRLD